MGSAEKKVEAITPKECLHCEHKWWPKAPGRPYTCPKCKNPRYDCPPRRKQTREEKRKDQGLE